MYIIQVISIFFFSSFFAFSSPPPPLPGIYQLYDTHARAYVRNNNNNNDDNNNNIM